MPVNLSSLPLPTTAPNARASVAVTSRTSAQAGAGAPSFPAQFAVAQIEKTIVTPAPGLSDLLPALEPEPGVMTATNGVSGAGAEPTLDLEPSESPQGDFPIDWMTALASLAGPWQSAPPSALAAPLPPPHESLPTVEARALQRAAPQGTLANLPAPSPLVQALPGEQRASVQKPSEPTRRLPAGPPGVFLTSAPHNARAPALPAMDAARAAQDTPRSHEHALLASAPPSPMHAGAAVSAAPDVPSPPLQSAGAMPAGSPALEGAGVDAETSTTTPQAVERAPVAEALASPLASSPATPGQASSSPPHAATPAARPNPVAEAWSAQNGPRFEAMQSGDALEMTLHSTSIGALRVQLAVHDGSGASAQFLVADASMRPSVEQALPALREALAQQGITLGEAGVHDGAHQGFAEREQARASVRRLRASLPEREEASALRPGGGVSSYA